MLRITGFLYEGACAAIGHQDEGNRPGFVVGAGGISLGGVYLLRIAQVGIGVVDILGDGSAVGRAAE